MGFEHIQDLLVFGTSLAIITTIESKDDTFGTSFGIPVATELKFYT
jgi:hypothetical protein